MDEVRVTAAQTLEVVHGLVQHRKAIMSGERTLHVLFVLPNFQTLDADENESTAVISHALSMFKVTMGRYNILLGDRIYARNCEKNEKGRT